MTTVQILKKDAVLVAIDFQEKLMPAIKDHETLEETTVKLIKGCRVLNVPILITQQYTKGLGPTTARITEAITADLFDGILRSAEYTPIEKTTFSAMKEPEFVKAITDCGKKTVIICGIEAHICVQQTALDLLEAGYQVFLVYDCVASRKESDKKQSRRRLAAAGAVVTTYESVLYEILGGAKEVGFKQISAIVK